MIEVGSQKSKLARKSVEKRRIAGVGPVVSKNPEVTIRSIIRVDATHGVSSRDHKICLGFVRFAPHGLGGVGSMWLSNLSGPQQ
jgi:hypothetical protein